MPQHRYIQKMIKIIFMTGWEKEDDDYPKNGVNVVTEILMHIQAEK